MTPAARLQAAIEILEGLSVSALPADRFIRDYFRARRYAGSKDRAAVAEHVFAIYRRFAHLSWRIGSTVPRLLALASAAEEGADVEALFSGMGHAPQTLTDNERAALARAAELPPLWVEGEFPPFLEAELTARFGANLLAEMAAMGARAPVDLRVNTLKSTRAEVLRGLRDAGFAAGEAAHAPLGIRLPAGTQGLERTALFEQGCFELQDEASQIAALLCDARAGMRVLDLAAGAGGKTLALAAAMENRGTLIASDISAARLAQLGPRAARAGASMIRFEAEPSGLFDRVLVDAPCSGSGSWRRQPDAKWRLRPERLTELTAIQDRLLARAAGLVRPGGRLIYATCSLLPVENVRRVAEFLAANPDFSRIDAGAVSASVAGGFQFAGPDFLASPMSLGTDGFYAAVLQRQA